MSGANDWQSAIGEASSQEAKVVLDVVGLLKRYASGEREFMSIDLAGSNLQGVNLRGAELSYADLSEADLQAADLRGVDFSYANLSHANLLQADLRGAILMGTNLKGANLQTALLSKADYDSSTRFPDQFDPVGANMGKTDQHSSA